MNFNYHPTLITSATGEFVTKAATAAATENKNTIIVMIWSTSPTFSLQLQGSHCYLACQISNTFL